jgi:hypothetical protein
MSKCEDEFYESFKNVTFHDNDGAIYVWREAWRKASVHFAELLEERANEWCKWNDKRMVSELRMVAENIKGELDETNE